MHPRNRARTAAVTHAAAWRRSLPGSRLLLRFPLTSPNEHDNSQIKVTLTEKLNLALDQVRSIWLNLSIAITTCNSVYRPYVTRSAARDYPRTGVVGATLIDLVGLMVYKI